MVEPIEDGDSADHHTEHSAVSSRGGQRPRKRGGRFSRMAASASLWSSDKKVTNSCPTAKSKDVFNASLISLLTAAFVY